MQDVVGPSVAAPASVVTRDTGRATSFWSNPTEIALTWGFDDLESGIKTVRASLSTLSDSPLTGPQDVEGLHALPLELSASVDERQGTIPLAEAGIVLAHNTRYYLHVCAEDHNNHTVCSAPWEILVDMTPPVCGPPASRVAGLAAPDFFSRRAGYGAAWECSDDESGVAFTDWMGYGDGSPLLTRKVKTLGGQAAGKGRGARTLTLDYVDGTRFHSCVSGVNGAGLYSLDTCTAESTFDGSAPLAGGPLIDEDGRPYRLSAMELCTTGIHPEALKRDHLLRAHAPSPTPLPVPHPLCSLVLGCLGCSAAVQRYALWPGRALPRGDAAGGQHHLPGWSAPRVQRLGRRSWRRLVPPVCSSAWGTLLQPSTYTAEG